jgi:hypothetical protein
MRQAARNSRRVCAVWNGKRAELEERYCRGDWSSPKTNASAATIGVAPEVIIRIHRLKSLTVEVRAGASTRRYQVVKSAGHDDLVFQSVKDGKPMADQNVLKRHIQPMARRLGLDFVDWQCLRRSYATWLVQSGADPKSVQRQMRHSRVSTSLDIYAQNGSGKSAARGREALGVRGCQSCSTGVPIIEAKKRSKAGTCRMESSRFKRQAASFAKMASPILPVCLPALSRRVRSKTVQFRLAGRVASTVFPACIPWS